eukprot:m.8802 g.8802  ORF g.8802 m.8802 type:complete len:176 (+) comp9290_c0_seq1:139-666(+)
MSLNLEKHLNPTKKYVKKKKEFVKCSSTKDLMKLRVERLMEHPEREYALPEPPAEAKQPKVLEFNPNIHGSNAGAGSGEFHVYRAERRREERRQKWLEDKERKQEEEVEFTEKEKQLKQEQESKTAKNRAKRQKAKMRKLQARVEADKAKKAQAALLSEPAGPALPPAKQAKRES